MFTKTLQLFAFLSLFTVHGLTPLITELIASGLGAANNFATIPSIGYLVSSNVPSAVYFVNGSTLATSVFFSFDGLIEPPTFNAGPLGIAIDPNFASNQYVYVYVARANSTGSGLNRIFRFVFDNGVGTDITPIYTVNPSTRNNFGGPLVIGPDGKLYLMVGDANSNNASLHNVQDWSSDQGKMLRMNLDGTFPGDNPQPGGKFARGLRNSFGYTFDPVTNQLWLSEMGAACNDEINLIVADGNYGWGPTQNCNDFLARPPPLNTNSDGPSPIMPLALLNNPAFPAGRPPTPTGLVFGFSTTLDSEYDNVLLVGTFITRQILAFTLDGSRTNFVSGPPEVVYNHTAPILGMGTDIFGNIAFVDTTGNLIRVLSAPLK